MSVAIIDYKMGNLASIRRSFEECGADVFITDNPDDLESATQIILPGVGAFADGMQHLVRNGWVDAIKKEVANNKPLLGICLGMQLLATTGHEGGKMEGIGLIDGEVQKLTPLNDAEKIPHVGWNELEINQHNSLLHGVEKECDFYFVHSYRFMASNQNDVVASTPYCGGLTSVIAKGNIFGVQFHPEKSQKPGFALIKNFLDI